MSPSGLHEALAAAFPGARVREQQRLKSRVHRVVLATAEGERAVVAKRLSAQTAERSRVLAERWLPAAGLADLGPPLLATTIRGGTAWQLYSDLGDRGLRERSPSREAVATVVEATAELHATFATHPLLPECRVVLGERGGGFLAARVRDARRGIGALRARGGLEPGQAALCDRVAALLEAIATDLPARVRALDELGGPETLLHGDLWPANAFALGGRARLIDWDRAAVGPVAYDVSTLLSRLPSAWRPWVLDAYRGALARRGVELPGDAALHAAFAAAELARCVDRLVWPSVAILTGEDVEWGWGELPEVETWFDGIDAVAA